MSFKSDWVIDFITGKDPDSYTGQTIHDLMWTELHDTLSVRQINNIISDVVGPRKPGPRLVSDTFTSDFDEEELGDDDVHEINKSEADKSRLKDEISLLRRRLQLARRAEDTAERVREEIWRIAGTSPTPPEWLLNGLSEGSHNPGVPMTVWSDWHFGEVVHAVEVAGMNEFNTEIGLERVKALVEKVIDLAKHHMVNPSYPGIVAALAGDMMSGDIHMELQDTNDMYSFQTLLVLQDVLVWAIKKLRDEFGNVFVPCVVGNHGRNTIKPRMKGRVHTSFEWLLYCQLERYFEDDPHVQVMVPGESDARFNVAGHRFLLTHGDSLGVKGGDGIIGAIGPIMRGSIKVGRSESQIKRDFDTIIMGHWHQYLTLPGIIVNGTLKGYDEFARLGLRAPYQRPTQALWFVHPKHGITAQWPIYLESLHEYNDTTNWVSWPSHEAVVFA